MINIYCPKCGRGYIEEVNRKEILEDILEEYYEGYYVELKVYKCNDCGYEFIGSKKERDLWCM